MNPELSTEAMPIYHGPMVQNHKRNLIIMLLLVALFIAGFVSVGLSLSYPSKPSKDSGVTACQQMAKNAAEGPSTSGVQMTQSEYTRIHQTFANSQFADLRVAGMNLIETVYNMQLDLSGSGVDALGTELGDLSRLESDWTILQTSCSNHGVTIPSLSSI